METRWRFRDPRGLVKRMGPVRNWERPVGRGRGPPWGADGGGASPPIVRGPHREKSIRGDRRGPYPKPTQVGEARSLRRARDLSLRNSAKSPRNFGRRGPGGEHPAGGRKQAQATVYHKHRSLRSRKTPYRG